MFRDKGTGDSSVKLEDVGFLQKNLQLSRKKSTLVLLTLMRRLWSRSRPLTANSSATGQQQIKTDEVRLVIWDLDDTFWGGTLTEGGIKYLQENHDIVVELATRGILSSICSRNEHGTIEALMREKEIWDYFVLPSISWESKGPRLRYIVEASRLRAKNILFIDDNPMNRAEATRFVAGINVAEPSYITSMLKSPLFKGKDDSKLTRLSQYKLLERRVEDMKVQSSDIFLRESEIQVYIDHDIIANIDRAIELINRTNQLNFTKLRLPEDHEAAKRELVNLLNGMEIQAGLVRVVDRYGDYGICGLYVQVQSLHSIKPKLIHFCFSCRTLGMEVETWLYQRLGRPELDVIGDVLTDIKDLKRTIDWISLASDKQSDAKNLSTTSRHISRIFVRGGCESVAISHYFEVLTKRLVTEFAFQREGLEVRLDHSLLLKAAVDPPSHEVATSLFALGYAPSDLISEIINCDAAADSVFILGLWGEATPAVFRHRNLDFRALATIGYKLGIDAKDLLSAAIPPLPEEENSELILTAMQELRSNFDYEGFMPADQTRDNVMVLLNALPKEALVVFIGISEKYKDPNGNLHDWHIHINLNKTLKECVDQREGTIFIGIDDHVGHLSDRIGGLNHFSREVYFRLFEDIRARIDEWAGAIEAKSSESLAG